MAEDLTVVFYTANYITDYFMNNITSNLLKAIGDTPLISVSHKPMDLGKNICVGDIGRSHLNIYRQALIGAKAATTPYIALAEDDILYSKSHFDLRPSRMDVFHYDINEWRLYTWSRPPIFSHKGNIVVHNLIAPRDYFVEAMDERFARYPDESKINLGDFTDPGRRKNEKRLGVTPRNREESYAVEPTIAFSHEDAFGYLHLGNRKRLADKRTDYVEPWGKAEDVLKLFRSREEDGVKGT